jgi:hypothetical protein
VIEQGNEIPQSELWTPNGIWQNEEEESDFQATEDIQVVICLEVEERRESINITNHITTGAHHTVLMLISIMSVSSFVTPCNALPVPIVLQ